MEEVEQVKRDKGDVLPEPIAWRPVVWDRDAKEKGEGNVKDNPTLGPRYTGSK